MAALSDPETRRRLDAGAQSDEAGILRHLAVWDRLIFEETFAPENAGLEGRSVGRGGRASAAWTPFDALLDVVVADGLRTGLRPPIGESEEDWALRAEVWQDPRAIVGGSDAGAHLDTMCGAIYSTSMLGDGVRARGLLSWEQAVRLLTDVPARLYGLRDRGRLVPGALADVVVLDPPTIGHGAVRTRDDLPGGASRLYAEAIGCRARAGERDRDRRATGSSPAPSPGACCARDATPTRCTPGRTGPAPRLSAARGRRQSSRVGRAATSRVSSSPVAGERVGQLALDLGEGVRQLGAEEDEPGAVLGGVAVGQRALGDEAVDERAPLLLDVVVRAVGVGQEGRARW